MDKNKRKAKEKEHKILVLGLCVAWWLFIFPQPPQVLKH
jgi:hypothetical protein